MSQETAQYSADCHMTGVSLKSQTETEHEPQRIWGNALSPLVCSVSNAAWQTCTLHRNVTELWKYRGGYCAEATAYERWTTLHPSANPHSIQKIERLHHLVNVWLMFHYNWCLCSCSIHLNIVWSFEEIPKAIHLYASWPVPACWRVNHIFFDK